MLILSAFYTTATGRVVSVEVEAHCIVGMVAADTVLGTSVVDYYCLAVVDMVLCSWLASLLTILMAYPNKLGITYKETNMINASNTK